MKNLTAFKTEFQFWGGASLRLNSFYFILFLLCFSLNTPPGTKVKLSGIVDIKNGFLLLNDTNTTVLGGEVEHLIEKWELQRVSINQEEWIELLKYCTLVIALRRPSHNE